MEEEIEKDAISILLELSKDFRVRQQRVFDVSCCAWSPVALLVDVFRVNLPISPRTLAVVVRSINNVFPLFTLDKALHGSNVDQQERRNDLGERKSLERNLKRRHPFFLIWWRGQNHTRGRYSLVRLKPFRKKSRSPVLDVFVLISHSAHLCWLRAKNILISHDAFIPPLLSLRP